MTQNVKIVFMDGKMVDTAVHRLRQSDPGIQFLAAAVRVDIDVSPLSITQGTRHE